jgi:hypothetical protein
MRFFAKKSDEATVVHAQRLTPQIAHLYHLVEQGHERRSQCDSPPRETPTLKFGLPQARPIAPMRAELHSSMQRSFAPPRKEGRFVA